MRIYTDISGSLAYSSRFTRGNPADICVQYAGPDCMYMYMYLYTVYFHVMYMYMHIHVLVCVHVRVAQLGKF